MNKSNFKQKITNITEFQPIVFMERRWTPITRHEVIVYKKGTKEIEYVEWWQENESRQSNSYLSQEIPIRL